MGFIPSECRTVVFSQWYVVIVYDSRWSTLCCRICVLKLNLLVSPRVLSFVFFSFCLTPLYVIVDVLPWNLRNRQQLRGIFAEEPQWLRKLFNLSPFCGCFFYRNVLSPCRVLFLPLFLSSSLGSCSRVQCQFLDYCSLPLFGIPGWCLCPVFRFLGLYISTCSPSRPSVPSRGVLFTYTAQLQP